MRQVELTFGVFVLIVGIGIALWGHGEADDMGVLRFEYPEEYRLYNMASGVGIAIGALGASLMIYGLVAKSHEEPPRIDQPPMPYATDTRLFCQYCGGRGHPENAYCEHCGERRNEERKRVCCLWKSPN